MKIYRLLRLAGLNSIPGPLKRFGLWLMLVSRRRCIGVFMDPVLACNIRCRMCYFSDPQKRKELHGVMSEDEIALMGQKLLPYALKLQIGCGAEPTLYPRLEQIVKMGREAGVPYISLTTNGQLIASGKISLRGLVDAGLDEITVSLHGTTRERYEDLMPGASFDLFKELLRQLAEVKRDGAKPAVRVNFTVNSSNINDLYDNRFFDIWDEAGVAPDIIQLRPVQNMGDTSWNDFDLTPLIENFDATFGNVMRRCRERGITCLAPPDVKALEMVDDEQEGTSAMIEDLTYCYVAPGCMYKPDFNAADDSFHSYHKRHKTAGRILRSVFTGVKSRGRNASKKLNYTVK